MYFCIMFVVNGKGAGRSSPSGPGALDPCAHCGLPSGVNSSLREDSSGEMREVCWLLQSSTSLLGVAELVGLWHWSEHAALAHLVRLTPGSQSAMGAPWIHCRPNSQASGCSRETSEHLLKQQYLAALPEGRDSAGEPATRGDQGFKVLERFNHGCHVLKHFFYFVGVWRASCAGSNKCGLKDKV